MLKVVFSTVNKKRMRRKCFALGKTNNLAWERRGVPKTCKKMLLKNDKTRDHFIRPE
jgi:hypothetical protein